MKIVAGLQVFEEEDFIRETLESICALCDNVIVVEGCWQSTQRVTGRTTSADRTNEYLQEACDKYSNLEVVHKHGSPNQVSHRKYILDLVVSKHPNATWFLMGDGDEVYHEKDFDQIRSYLSQKKRLEAVSFYHKLFWNNLQNYSQWNTAGARFFNIRGLDHKSLRVIQCNTLGYKTQGFKIHRPKNNIFCFHMSYCKNKNRQLIKWKHRNIDDNRPIPHKITQDGQIVGKALIQKHNIEDLPKCLQRHPLANVPTLLNT